MYWFGKRNYTGVLVYEAWEHPLTLLHIYVALLSWTGLDGIHAEWLSTTIL